MEGCKVQESKRVHACLPDASSTEDSMTCEDKNINDESSRTLNLILQNVSTTAHRTGRQWGRIRFSWERERSVSRNGLSPWPIWKDCAGDQAHGGTIKRRANGRWLGTWNQEWKSLSLYTEKIIIICWHYLKMRIRQGLTHGLSPNTSINLSQVSVSSKLKYKTIRINHYNS